MKEGPMTSKEFKKLRRRLTSAPVKGDTPIEEARAGFEALMAEYTPSADIAGVIQEDEMSGTVPARWVYTPDADPERVLLYLHGGGFTMGSALSHLDILARLSMLLSARVLAIDYRLAPEHPFPAALEDSVESYRWLLESGADPSMVVIAGSSAGGGLALSTLLALREDMDPLPAACVCLCPFTDMTLQGASLDYNEGKDWVTRSRVQQVVETYLAGADPTEHLASPLLEDLEGLPPLFIQVGGDEILLDDSQRMAERAREAGVEVDLDVWPEMIHIWQLFAAAVPEGREALENLSRTMLQKIAGWRDREL
jgi:monoterpene epsilon-lactone hydrolase